MPKPPQRKATVAHSVSELDRLSRFVGAPIDEAAVDRILKIISLVGTTGILAPDVDAETLDEAIAAEIKRVRWGGALRTSLGFLTAIVRRRSNASLARKEIARLKKAVSKAEIALRELEELDQGNDATLALAAAALARLQDNIKEAWDWSDERIAGEFLPALYGIFGKRPKITRPGKTGHSGETVRFVQAVMGELGIVYSRESIIRAMTGAKKPKRRR
jgi:hypothetical protein